MSKPPLERRPLRGTLRWRDGDQVDITLAIDKLAVSNTSLVMASVVGYGNDIKAFRAALAVCLRQPMDIRGPDGKKMVVRRGGEETALEYVYASGGKYAAESYRLGYSVHHAIFIARDPRLMIEDTDEALWAALKHPRFTTPLLPGWLPYLRRELMIGNFLAHCDCLDCSCMVLTATTADLDQIVEHGLKNGLITISQEEAA